MTIAATARTPRALLERTLSAVRPRRVHLSERKFWTTQLLVAAATVVLYGFDSLVPGSARNNGVIAGGLHDIPIMFYIVPVMYAALVYGFEGAVLTTLWSAASAVPHSVLVSHENFEWVGEVGAITTILIAGIFLALQTESERQARHRAEELAARVSRMNRLILHAQEEERLRIAHDLHDDTIQQLIYLCQRLDRMKVGGALAQRERDELAEVRAVAESTLTGVRRFSGNLRPSILDDLGLAAAIEWLAHDVASRGSIEVRFECTGVASRLPVDRELALFRIVQEALRNVERHADASRVIVAVSFRDDAVAVRVTDNGRGFDPNVSLGELVARGHLGLGGMQERAEVIGARLNVRTVPGSGTIVEVVLNGSTGRR